MILSELLKAIQPIQIIGSTETEITGVNIDSRLVQAGHLFMAMLTFLLPLRKVPSQCFAKMYLKKRKKASPTSR